MSYTARHIGLNESDWAKALSVIGVSDADELMDSSIPPDIRMHGDADLPPALDEEFVSQRLRELASKNRLTVGMYGMGYFPCVTPAVIRRNIVENPSWYTAYTPYQPEISQGRLEALMIFQTMVSDLMGLPVAASSLLDEATAAAEAIGLARRSVKRGTAVVVDSRVYPTTIDVIRTRCSAHGIDLTITDDIEQAMATSDPFCVVIAQYGSMGELRSTAELTSLAANAHARGALVIATSDLLAATLVTAPGEWGADVAVGSAQRFGTPLWYGGPAAGFIAVRQDLMRQMPGRLVGQSVDTDGNAAFRLTLQTREQHIRREKATSNICTAQVLVAVTAAFYAMWHGPRGLTAMAREIHSMASLFAHAAAVKGYGLVSDNFFDTVTLRIPDAKQLAAVAHDMGVGITARDDDTLTVAFGEGITTQTMDVLAEVLGLEWGQSPSHLGDSVRTSNFLTADVFHAYHSETGLMRYMKTLADRDYALDRGMIPLGSCTMKLNPAAAMEAITLPGFAGIHPYAPTSDAAGYQELIDELGTWLKELTGMDAVSFQPNSGAQGEFAGLMSIRRYHASRGENRDVCLLPTSAHGTNAASAAMAGFTVIPVAATDDGSIDVDDLAAKAQEYGSRVAAIMVTYPSTHGVYETTIRDVERIVHGVGGQVYIDGANFNALVGMAHLSDLGADACHLNLHKTFGMPHGGGGPGVGPIAVKSHLTSFLPGHELLGDGEGAVAGAPFGSAGILPISYAYIALLGADGLKRATTGAVIEANYISTRLKDAFPTLYVGANGHVAHECILALRPISHESGISVDDVAKRLIDYGFHAPTMSFPVAGTLMVEPTESETLSEIDRFCDAMIAIRAEIDRVISGEWDPKDNPLVNAPHPAHRLLGAWDHPYSRELGAYPGGVHLGPVLGDGSEKYWPPVGRIDGAYGDRHLIVRL